VDNSESDSTRNAQSIILCFYTTRHRCKKQQHGFLSDFCGYHSHINKSLFYAVVPYHDCLACTTNLISFDTMTITASHELCEAITDPVPGGGWYNAIYGEVGDYPDRGKKIVLGYKVQTEFSNKVNKSV
jgi:hypothetical protein